MSVVDYSSQHDVLLLDEDGTMRPMDEPYHLAAKIAPNTWSVVSDGDLTYLLVGDEDTLVIDTGCGAGDLRAFMQTLTDKKVWRVANTHDHFDHTANNCNFDLVYMAKEGVGKAGIPFRSYSECIIPTDYPIEVIGDGYKFELGNREIEVIALPDHAASSLLYLDKGARILFAGDELTDHGKALNGTVENCAKQMLRLMGYRSQFDWICCGSDAMISAEYVERYLVCAEYILAGHEGHPMGPGPGKDDKHRDVLPVGPNGETVYERQKPRRTDMGGGGKPGGPGPARLMMEYAGCYIIYDPEKIR